MNYFENPKVTIKLNNRAKIEITSVKEFDTIKGYDVKLLYWLKNKYTRKYSWTDINSKYISAVIVLNDSDEMINTIDSLINRKNNFKKTDKLIKNKLTSNIKNRWNLRK